MTLGGRRFGLGVLAFGLAVVFFGMRAAPGVTFEDSGELAAAAASWGVPHPPGFPLLTVLGGLLARVLGPFGVGPAQAMAWLSVLAGAAAVGMVVRFVGGARGERPVAGLLAGGLLCLSPTFAAQAVVVEAYALSAALAAGLLLAADAGRARTAGVLFGLGLAAHPAGALSFPLLAFAVLRSSGPKKPWAKALVGVLIGLAVYLYVPLAAARGPALNWGGIHDAGSLFDHLLRRQFGGGPERDLVAQATFLAEHLVGQWPLVLLVAMVAGAMARGPAADATGAAAQDAERAVADGEAATGNGAEAQAASASSAALDPLEAAGRFYRAPLVFTTLLITALGLFWAQHWPIGEEITRVRLAGSFTPLVLWMAVLTGLGLARLEARFQARGGRAYRLPMLLVGLLFASLHPAPDYTRFGADSPTYTPGRATLAEFTDMRDAVEAEAYARFVLEGLPPDAVVVVNRLGYSDVLTFPLWYGQVALDLAPDVVVINRELLGLEWYRHQLAQRRAELAGPLERLGATYAALAASPEAGDPRARRLASVPFLRELAGSLPGGLAMLGRPSPRIAEGLPLTATDVAWWLGAGAPASNTAPAWPFLDRARYPDPWRHELAAMARARDAFRGLE